MTREEILNHYKGLNFDRYVALWDYAAVLYNGNDVDMGGGEYAQTINVEDRHRYYNIINKAFKELEPYEDYIKTDYNIITRHSIYSSMAQAPSLGVDEARYIETLYAICNSYRKEIEPIKDVLGLEIAPPEDNKIFCKQNKPKKRGRQSKPFRYCLQDKAKLRILHNAMSGKTGKEAALVIKVAIKIGWVTKPTYKAVVDEFGNIGAKSNYNRYIGDKCFTNDEIEGMKSVLLSY